VSLHKSLAWESTSAREVHAVGKDADFLAKAP
jgi:hypothetical protein